MINEILKGYAERALQSVKLQVKKQGVQVIEAVLKRYSAEGELSPELRDEILVILDETSQGLKLPRSMDEIRQLPHVLVERLIQEARSRIDARDYRTRQTSARHHHQSSRFEPSSEQPPLYTEQSPAVEGEVITQRNEYSQQSNGNENRRPRDDRRPYRNGNYSSSSQQQRRPFQQRADRG